MVIVVRLGPRRSGVAVQRAFGELERIFARAVEHIEVSDAATLAAAMQMHDVLAVALDASGPEELAVAVAAAPPAAVGTGAQQPPARSTSCSTATAFSPPMASSDWLRQLSTA